MKKIDKIYIDKIKIDFQKMRSKEDFLDLLNFAKSHVYNDDVYPFKLNQINWYSIPKISSNKYKSFSIKKKNGAERIIHAPNNGLKSLQKTISFILQCVFEPHKAAYGFVPNKSIVDNARIHSGERYVYNIDLKDFFPSIDQARVWKCLQLPPFNLNKEFSENLDKAPINLSVKVYNSINNRKKLNNISILKYEGSDLPAGKFKIDLKEEGILIFKVYKKIEGKDSGKIVLLKKESQLDLIKKTAINIIEKDESESELDLDYIIDYICSQLIKSFFQKGKITINREKIASIIASVCCFEMEVDRFDKEKNDWKREIKNVLPQGAPTSPVLTNVICSKLDRRLSGIAKRFGLNYTRYADDITFSSSHNVYQEGGEFLDELKRVINDQGFTIKESKTRLQKEGYRQEVTGLLVGEKVNVQKRYIKQIRMWLYYWETYGLQKSQEIFNNQYTKDKGHIKNHVPNLSIVLKGKLDFLKMVVGDNSPVYLKFIKRFNKLTNKINVTQERGEYLNDILKEIINSGIKSAMKNYK